MSHNTKLLLRTIVGIVLWLLGSTFVFIAMRKLLNGADFWAWLGHLGQGVIAVLVGFAIMPYTAINDYLKHTFSKR